jgi:hypothetical protein
MEILEPLLDGLRTVCAGFPDGRRIPDPDVDYAMADMRLSAFSLFFMKASGSLPISGGWSKATAPRIAKRCAA